MGKYALLLTTILSASGAFTQLNLTEAHQGETSERRAHQLDLLAREAALSGYAEALYLIETEPLASLSSRSGTLAAGRYHTTFDVTLGAPTEVHVRVEGAAEAGGDATQYVIEAQFHDLDGVEVPTGEQGEIWFKGPSLIRGYWNRPEATAEALVDGWLRTGDVGRVDEDGFVYVEDRAKDLVLRAGENVSCAEVEAAVYEHPAVYEAAVFGVPHERLGEEVAVAVLPKEGLPLDADELRAHVADRLAAFKVPSRVVVVGERLPRNAAGKILKRELRDQVAAST